MIIQRNQNAKNFWCPFCRFELDDVLFVHDPLLLEFLLYSDGMILYKNTTYSRWINFQFSKNRAI